MYFYNPRSLQFYQNGGAIAHGQHLQQIQVLQQQINNFNKAIANPDQSEIVEYNADGTPTGELDVELYHVWGNPADNARDLQENLLEKTNARLFLQNKLNRIMSHVQRGGATAEQEIQNLQQQINNFNKAIANPDQSEIVEYNADGTPTGELDVELYHVWGNPADNARDLQENLLEKTNARLFLQNKLNNLREQYKNLKSQALSKATEEELSQDLVDRIMSHVQSGGATAVADGAAGVTAGNTFESVNSYEDINSSKIKIIGEKHMPNSYFTNKIIQELASEILDTNTILFLEISPENLDLLKTGNKNSTISGNIFNIIAQIKSYEMIEDIDVNELFSRIIPFDSRPVYLQRIAFNYNGHEEYKENFNLIKNYILKKSSNEENFKHLMYLSFIQPVEIFLDSIPQVKKDNKYIKNIIDKLQNPEDGLINNAIEIIKSNNYEDFYKHFYETLRVIYNYMCDINCLALILNYSNKKINIVVGEAHAHKFKTEILSDIIVSR